MLILFFLISSCAELIYDNKANINYDVYSTAFVYYISAPTDFPLKKNKSLEFIVDKLETVSGFDQIYNERNSPEMEDSADVQIIITIKSYKWDYYEDDEEDENYKTKVRVQCAGINTRTGDRMFRFTEQGEEDEELGFLSDDEEELDHEALKQALDDISIFFLKSFKI